MKRNLFTLFLTLGSAFTTVVPAQEIASSWDDSVIKIKAEMHQELKKHNMPFISNMLRGGAAAQKVTIDVSGLKQLILTAWETPDGNGSDHSVWANARLTTVDGETVWLDELKTVKERSGYGQIERNRDQGGSKLTIGGKVYDRGIFIHAPGELVFNLDGKYTKFEAEVGINKSGSGSVIFRAQNISADKYVRDINKEYSKELSTFLRYAGTSADSWLTTTDVSVEKSAAKRAVSRLNNCTYYNSVIDKIAQKNDTNQQIKDYLSLIAEVDELLSIQAQLEWVNVEAIKAAYSEMSTRKSFDKESNKKLLDFIVANYGKANTSLCSGDKTNVELAKDVIKAKRDLLMANPLFDMDKILVGRYKIGSKAESAMAPSLGTQPNNWSSQPSASKSGFDAEIAVLSNLRGDIESNTIFKPENSTSVTDINLHWDADRLLFTMVDQTNKWQVYEVGIDGKGLKKVIKSPEEDLDFCDGIYLPDGRVIATSTIGYHGVPCVNGLTPVCNTILYNPENSDLRRLTFDQDGNWNPFVMNNGRIMYTRWEYTDLTHYFSRFVMHMNPDGTENKALYGSGSFWPNSTFDMKPLPGSTNQFVAIISGHHGVARSGRLMIFDPNKSRKEEQGVVQEMPFKDRKIIPEVKDQLVDGVWPQFIKPFPLDDKYFLVAAKLSPTSLWGIYLVDVYDNLTLIAEYPGEGLIQPIPVVKRATPPVIPDRVNLEDKESTIFIQDIYEGEGLAGVPRGTVKELRLYAFEFAYNNSPSDHYAQGIQAGWDIKRLLGTVPVEEDGSVIFKVPANVPISLQPLDSLGRAVQWMRSWITSMPGETVSCIGCHEDQNQIPMPKRTIASQKAPHKIVTPEGGVRSITFDLEIQPILDRACIACHNDKSSVNFVKGESEGPLDWMGFKRNFSSSYLAFHPYIYRQGPEAEMYVLKPYEYHASNSEVVRILEKGHHGVELKDSEWRALYRWIDMNTPYGGTFEDIANLSGYDQYDRRIELADKYNKAGIDWRKELVDYASYLKGKGEITPVTPEVQEAKEYKEAKLKGWPNKELQAVELERKSVEIAPGVSLNFVKVPAGKFVMGSNDGEKDHAPAFKTKVKDSYWIAETELTNEQYRALVPEHDSRIIGQFWKDHTTAGLPANLPQQPVIRVSWEEAMAYCEELSAATGLNIKLPTETQWELAAKCGLDQSFWYGGVDSNFGEYENLADASLSKMAVSGIDPQPMSKNDPWFKYYDYIPKDAKVNDGNMIVCNVASYEPSPWGLYDIYGNVAEWTRSEYVDYPLSKSKNSNLEKVVRGGSWMDRPKFSTSNTRKSFLPWQKVYNVGIRLVIEE